MVFAGGRHENSAKISGSPLEWNLQECKPHNLQRRDNRTLWTEPSRIISGKSVLCAPNKFIGSRTTWAPFTLKSIKATCRLKPDEYCAGPKPPPPQKKKKERRELVLAAFTLVLYHKSIVLKFETCHMTRLDFECETHFGPSSSLPEIQPWEQ